MTPEEKMGEAPPGKPDRSSAILIVPLSRYSDASAILAPLSGTNVKAVLLIEEEADAATEQAWRAVAKILRAEFHALRHDDPGLPLAVYRILKRLKPWRVYLALTGSAAATYPLLIPLLRYSETHGARLYVLHKPPGASEYVAERTPFKAKTTLPLIQRRVFKLVYEADGDAIPIKDVIARYRDTRPVYKASEYLRQKGLLDLVEAKGKGHFVKTLAGRILYQLLKEDGAI